MLKSLKLKFYTYMSQVLAKALNIMKLLFFKIILCDISRRTGCRLVMEGNVLVLVQSQLCNVLLKLSFLMLVTLLPVLNLNLQLMNSTQMNLNLLVCLFRLPLFKGKQFVKSSLFSFYWGKLSFIFLVNLFQFSLEFFILWSETFNVQSELLLGPDVKANVVLQFL